MTRIARVRGRRVWDSRARPTVEAEVILDSGIAGRAIAPAGASMGSGEAMDLRDGGAALGGWDVRRAVEHVETEIAAALQGMDIGDQAAIDRRLVELDGTPQKARLGGNATIAVSMAALHAAAAAAGVPLYAHLARGRPMRIPVPEIQILGGGAHAGRRVDIQDFLVMCPSAGSFAEALDRTAEVYHAAGRLLREVRPRRRRRRRRRLVAGLRQQRGGTRSAPARHRGGGLHPGPGGAYRARHRRFRLRQGRALQAGPGRTRARPRRHGRAAAVVARALSDPVDRGPVRRGRSGGFPPLHRGGRRARAGGRRRSPGDAMPAASPRPRRGGSSPVRSSSRTRRAP